MATKTYMSPQRAPVYVLHRDTTYAADVIANITKDKGILMQDYQYALLEVIPVGGANPTLSVLNWCEKAGLFVPDHAGIDFTAKGVNTPWAAVVPVYGQRIFAAITGGPAAGTVKVMVSGFHPNQV